MCEQRTELKPRSAVRARRSRRLPASFQFLAVLGFLLTGSSRAQVTDNTPPTLESIPAQTIGEDVPLAGLLLGVGDAETPLHELELSATSSDPELVPEPVFRFSGSPAAWELTIVPATNWFGSATVTVTVKDRSGGEVSRSFGLTVLPVDDPPRFDEVPPHIAEPGSRYSWSVSASDPDPSTILRISAPVLPGWLSFDPETRLLAGQPPVPGGPEGDAVRLELSDGSSPIVPLEFRIWTADSITISNNVDVAAKRDRLVRYIWGDAGWPTARTMPVVLHDISFDFGYFDSIRNEAGNLDRIDFYSCWMPHNINSYIWHLHPRRSNGRLFVYHSGHSWGGFMSEELSNNSGQPPGFVIPALLREGYSVLVFALPIYNGNPFPVVERPEGGTVALENHDDLFHYVDRPFRFFFEPVAVALNYVLDRYSYSKVFMTGLSGGGWMSTVYPALDLRIERSFPVAGTVPNYLRVGFEGLGDSEQDDPGFYRIANYKELYAMAAAGFDRAHLQILIQNDPCCFYGSRHTNWVDEVKESVSRLPDGDYDFFLDEETLEHRVSAVALDQVIKALPPFIDPIPDLNLEPDSPSQEIVVTGIRPGSVGRTQPPIISVETDRPEFLSNLRVETVSEEGTARIRFTPAAGAVGLAVVRATVREGSSALAVARRRFVVNLLSPNVRPTVAWIVPEDYAELEPFAAVDLSVEAVDPDGIVERVEFFDGPVSLGVVTFPPFLLSATGLEPGDHVLTAIATDNRGGESAYAMRLVRMLPVNTPPAVSLIVPSATNQIFQGDSFQVRAEASDMDGYVRQVDVVAFMLGPPIGDRPERPVIGTNLIASLSEPPYECVWTPPTAATYTLKIAAVDNRGATAWSDPVTVRVLSSNQSPSLVWLTPEDHVKRVVVGDTVDFQLLGYDTDGRIERITLELDGSLLSESSGSEFHFSWSPTVPTSVTLTATAVDDRGGVVTLPARILDIVEPLTIPVRILGVEIHPLNGTTLRVAGPSGWTLVLESSTDLLHWDPVGTNTLSSGSSRIVDPALPTAPARFYRARIE